MGVPPAVSAASAKRKNAGETAPPQESQRIAMKLILASSSPRRAEVLRDAGIAFEVRVALVDETRLLGEAAQKMVARLAEAKARAASLAASGDENCIVIGADTVVELDGEIFGKPRDAAQAVRKCSAL